MDEEEREPQEDEHMDDVFPKDLADLFPWLPRGTHIRVT